MQQLSSLGGDFTQKLNCDGLVGSCQTEGECMIISDKNDIDVKARYPEGYALMVWRIPFLFMQQEQGLKAGERLQINWPVKLKF